MGEPVEPNGRAIEGAKIEAHDLSSFLLSDEVKIRQNGRIFEPVAHPANPNRASA
jgi:hypothetical protein